MLFVIYIITLIYGGLIIGTYLKFKENGVSINGGSRFILLTLPFIILWIHLVLLVRYISERKKISMMILGLPIIKYPLIIGVLIELLLEKQAQAVARKSRAIDKTTRISKKVQNINAVRAKVGFDIGIVKDAANIYKKKLLTTEAV